MENYPFGRNDFNPANIASAGNYGIESYMETIKYLQDKISAKHNEYQVSLKEKDSIVRDLKSQIASLDQHIKDLTERYSQANDDLMQEQLLAQVKVEETKKLLTEQKMNHQKEMRLIAELLERSKFEIKTLTEKLDLYRKEKEDLKFKIKDLEIKSAELGDAANLCEKKLAESKKAVEETLGNLFEERKKSAESGKKTLELEKKISDLNKELENMRFNWDAERKEWRELWERERSVWETHRQEFAVWEERLRSEREAWLERLRKEEEKGIDYAGNMTKLLEDTSKWSEKVTQILKLYAVKGVQLPQVFVTPEVIKAKATSAFKKILVFSLAAATLMAASFWWAYDYKNKLHLSHMKSFTLESLDYTAVSIIGDKTALAAWSGFVAFKNKEGALLSKIDNFSGQKAKISAMAAAGENLWILDMAQLRFIKIDQEGKIINSIKTAGPAPQGVAFDGFNIWSFDASTGLIYKYSLGSDISGIITYNIPGIKTVESMQWNKDILAIVSNGSLMRYKFSNENFSKISKQKMKNVVSSYIEQGQMYAIVNNGSMSFMELYRVKN